MASVVSYSTTRRIEFADTDMAGIAHFARFFCLMEQVEHEFLRSRGLSVMLEHDGQQLGFPRVSATCDYQQPARFEDVLDVLLTLERVGDKSLTYAFVFSKAGVAVARGRLVTCCCQVVPGQGMTAIPIPLAIRERLTAL